MPETLYTYRGPTSGVTIIHAGEQREVMLHEDGPPVRLPSDHPHVQALIAQRRLTKIEPPARPSGGRRAPRTRKENT